MRLRSVISLCVLVAFLTFPLTTTLSQADENELGQVTQSISAKGSRWQAKHTRISQLRGEQRRHRLGAKRPVLTQRERKLNVTGGNLPAQLDWRNYSGRNYVTPVKEQGECGACWAFAATAALESKVLISRNTPDTDLDLSEQVMTSCSGAGTCAAGAVNDASDFICNYGLPPESCYPYCNSEGVCSNACPNWEADAYRISGWSLVNPTIASIKYALYNYGPLVALMAVHNDFFYYGSGIYTHSWGDFEGYHAALIVGYDDLSQSFIVKSSWGADWGEDGYFRIAYSEMNSETQFGAWTIAYERAIPAAFPVIEDLPREPILGSDGNGGQGNGGSNEDDGSASTGSNNQGNTQDNGKGGDKKESEKNDAATPSVLSGTVKDQSGAVIDAAEVKANKKKTATDSEGKYAFPDIAPGDYLVSAGKENYTTAAVNVDIPPGTAVTKDFVLAQNGTGAKKPKIRKSGVRGPGWFREKGEAVSPEEAAAYFASQEAQATMAQGGGMPLASNAWDVNTDLQALAIALHNDPRLIYDYVHNNIEYIPYHGSLKGAILTYLDGSGNDYDQASLMIALLRYSGYNSTYYVVGQMTIPNADLADWLGVATSEISNVLSDGGIPHTVNGDGTINMKRIWVKTTIDGQIYLFDPAFKAYTNSTKINLTQATGYMESGYLSAATAGATIDTNSVKNLNENNLRNQLTSYTSGLVGAIRSQYPNADMKEIIGGRDIIQTSAMSHK